MNSQMNIKIEIQSSPAGFDVAFAPCDDFGNPGNLNMFILNELGIDMKNGLPKPEQLTEGFAKIEGLESECSVVYIVTASRNNSSLLLESNFSNALNSFSKSFENKRVWIPLMGVGSAHINIKDSFIIIYNTLNRLLKRSFNPKKIVISIPHETDSETLGWMKAIVASGESIPVENKEKSQEKEQQTHVPEESDTYDEKLIKLKKLLVPGRRFFTVDYLWNKIDQMDRFIQEKIWENEPNSIVLKTIYEVNDGDILFGKLVYSDYLRIDAIGVVKNNFKDGRKLSVNWRRINPIAIQEIRGTYRGAIKQIKRDDEKRFLTVLISGQPNLIEIISELESAEYKNKAILIEPSDEENLNSATSIEDINVNRETDKDKIPFHLDQVVEVDKLGREPVAKAFVNLIKKDIFTDKLNHSFMVHLQGEWGAGKSSFLNFISKNLNIGDEEWIVVNYNAWQNQHISPPWWTLIDQIYRQAESKFKGDGIKGSSRIVRWRFRFVLWIKENYRRMIWYSGWQKTISLIFTIGFISLIIVFGNSILQILANKTVSSSNIDNAAKGLTIDIFAKLIVTLGSALGVIYSFSKFISTPFLMRSSSEAVSFMSRASDPMNKIKNHFSNLVDNINSKKKKRQLAIFIDDIDRCNKEFIVHLLEGIQTLFKDKRVLYIVSGEKKWITTSFGNTYKEFSSEQNNSDELGELFLEKAFQLSFRMPNVEEDAKKEYWNYILGLPEKEIDEKTKVNSFENLNAQKKIEVKAAITNATEDIASPEFMKQFGEKYKLTKDTVSDLVIEEKNSDASEIRHLLKGFHSVIDANPRSIIRLANNYTMTRSTLIAERKNVSADKIFRWLVI